MRWGPLAVALLLLPMAQAQHPPAGLLVAQGLVLADGGPALAVLSFRPCEGVTQVTVTLDTPQGRVRDTFDALLEFLAPPDVGFAGSDCLIDFLPPATVFRLGNDTIGTEWHGVAETGAHFVLVTGVSGWHRGRASAFGAAAA